MLCCSWCVIDKIKLYFGDNLTVHLNHVINLLRFDIKPILGIAIYMSSRSCIETGSNLPPISGTVCRPITFYKRHENISTCM